MGNINMTKKKKNKEIPEIVHIKTIHMDNHADISIDLDKTNNEITIHMKNHEIHQYLRHRVRYGRFTYDPLNKYKVSVTNRLSNIINADKELSNFIEERKDRAIETFISVTAMPSKSSSLKKIYHQLLGDLYRTSTPDVDNFTKTLFDISNTLLWNDDAQVYKHSIVKNFGKMDETLFKIKYMEDTSMYNSGRLKRTK